MIGAHQDESQASEIAKKDQFGVSRNWFLVILPWFGGRPNIERRKSKTSELVLFHFCWLVKNPVSVMVSENHSPI